MKQINNNKALHPSNTWTASTYVGFQNGLQVYCFWKYCRLKIEWIIYFVDCRCIGGRCFCTRFYIRYHDFPRPPEGFKSHNGTPVENIIFISKNELLRQLKRLWSYFKFTASFQRIRCLAPLSFCSESGQKIGLHERELWRIRRNVAECCLSNLLRHSLEFPVITDFVGWQLLWEFLRRILYGQQS